MNKFFDYLVTQLIKIMIYTNTWEKYKLLLIKQNSDSIQDTNRKFILLCLNKYITFSEYCQFKNYLKVDLH